MKRTPEQNIRFHKLIGILRIDADLKRELVEQYSNGRETSSAELTYQEMKVLIDYLQEAVPRDPVFIQKRKVFALAHELGWELPGGAVNKDRLNAWLMKYGYLHKGLHDYTARELPALLSQLENILKKEYK